MFRLGQWRGGSRAGASPYPRGHEQGLAVVAAGRPGTGANWPARADDSPGGRSVAAAVVPGTAPTTNPPAPGWRRVPTGRLPGAPGSPTTARPTTHRDGPSPRGDR